MAYNIRRDLVASNKSGHPSVKYNWLLNIKHLLLYWVWWSLVVLSNHKKQKAVLNIFKQRLIDCFQQDCDYLKYKVYINCILNVNRLYIKKCLTNEYFLPTNNKCCTSSNLTIILRIKNTIVLSFIWITFNNLLPNEYLFEVFVMYVALYFF